MKETSIQSYDFLIYNHNTRTQGVQE
jgi:hypothetical protein